MAEYTADLRDIKFTLFEQLGLEKLFETEKFNAFSREDVDMILDEAYKFAREVLGPLNRPGDLEGVHFDKQTGKVTTPKGFIAAHKQLGESGWQSLSVHQEWGGGGLPLAVGSAAAEFMFGGNLAYHVTPLLTVGAAHLVESFGTEEQKQTFLKKMYACQWGGTMCLTEAGAGSDVGASKCKAKKDGDHFLIEGEKVFISAAEDDLTQQKVHMVLARTEGAPKGVKGLSLFIVPKYRVKPDGSLGDFNDVACSNIEHKMGIHASPTCTLVFGQNGGCHGYLLGKECDGIKLMFQMMNEARLSVGIQGTAVANAAYQGALAYARERLQGSDLLKMRDENAPRVPIIQHADVRHMLMWQKAIAEGCRALVYKTAMYEDLAQVSTGNEKEKYEGLLGLLTPVCKAFCTDMGFRATEYGVQIHGGYGFTQEYSAEQYLRDIKIASIWEGSNGIQAMDLVGRKLPQKMGANLMALAGEINAFTGANKDHPVLGADVARLQAAVGALGDASMYFAGIGMKDPHVTMLNATTYLSLFGDTVVGWLLLDQAVIAHQKLRAIGGHKAVDAADQAAMRRLVEEDEEARYYDAKIKTAKFWATRRLSLARANADLIKAGDRTPLEIIF
jgi:hypothetical protein